MTPREEFLSELRQRTTDHLEALAAESAETFGRHIGLPEVGGAIYHRLVEQFNMDGAQEISGALIDLFAGELDEGTVTLSDREFRGLRTVMEEFDRDLPEAPRQSLRDLITALSRADKGGT